VIYGHIPPVIKIDVCFIRLYLDGGIFSLRLGV
jgi:hypothetical protein